MTINLPDWPNPTEVVPRVLDFGGFLQGSGGAPTQRANQLGNRYAVAVTMPPLDSGKWGRIWVNRLIKAQQQGCRMPYALGDFYPGTPNQNGIPITVDGAGQAGNQLAVQGVQPAYGFVEGQPISLEITGQHYFDFVAENAIADEDGKVTIKLSQMLRKPPAAGSVLHVAKPMIEGFVVGDALSWAISLEKNISLNFEIHEAR